MIVTLFLLLIIGLLIGAAVKTRLEKIGFDTSRAWSSSRAWWEVCASLFWSHLADRVLTCVLPPDLPFSPFSHLVRLTRSTLSHLHPHTQDRNTTGYREKRSRRRDSYSSRLDVRPPDR